MSWLGPAPASIRLDAAAGLERRREGGKMFIDCIVSGSVAWKQKIDFDWEMVSVQQKADRPPKQLPFIPALILLGLMIVVQRGRRARRRSPPGRERPRTTTSSSRSTSTTKARRRRRCPRRSSCAGSAPTPSSSHRTELKDCLLGPDAWRVVRRAAGSVLVLRE